MLRKKRVVGVLTRRNVLGYQSRNVGKWSVVPRDTHYRVSLSRQRDFGLWLRRIVSWYLIQPRRIRDSVYDARIEQICECFSPHESGKCANLLTLDQRRLFGIIGSRDRNILRLSSSFFYKGPVPRDQMQMKTGIQLWLARSLLMLTLSCLPPLGGKHDSITKKSDFFGKAHKVGRQSLAITCFMLCWLFSQ